ncbi:MAG TPA: YceI family protein [Rhizomicrobium sp.]|jgi:polyisoprenoid-binding protein YceI
MRLMAFAASLAAGLVLTLGAHAQTISRDPTHAPNGTYEADAGHSQVLFSIVHLGLTDYYGRFDKLSGTLNFDGNQPEHSSLSITIDTTTIDTPSERLVGELKGADVFDTAQFPTATFKSTSTTRTGPNTGHVTGMLTIRNVTKPVTLDVVFNGGTQNPMSHGYSLGFRATATIKRSDFGLTTMGWSPFVSDDVQLVIEAMFNQQKS